VHDFCQGLFLDAFAKLRKATISFLMSSVRLSVRPSVHPHGTLGCHWTDLREIWYWSIIHYLSKKIQVYLKCDTNKNTYFLSYLDQFFLEREMFPTKIVDKRKTHILISIPCFSKMVRFTR